MLILLNPWCPFRTVLLFFTSPLFCDKIAVARVTVWETAAPPNYMSARFAKSMLALCACLWLYIDSTRCTRFTTSTLALLPRVTCATLQSHHSCYDIDLSPKMRTGRLKKKKKKKKKKKPKHTNKQTFHFHRPPCPCRHRPFLESLWISQTLYKNVQNLCAFVHLLSPEAYESKFMITHMLRIIMI